MHDLFDSKQSDVPEWIERSFRREVPRVSPTEMAKVLSRMPETLKKGLMPFQWEGVKFGLQRNTRCLIGDEMGAHFCLIVLCSGVLVTFCSRAAAA